MKKINVFVMIVLLHLSNAAFSQKADSLEIKSHFSGSLTVTNNGISLVPTFSLGKPAVIFNLSIGKGRLSFEPDMRFSLEGRPWSFLFWWRYQLAQSEKFRMNVGAHPAMNFKTSTVILNGISQEQIIARRYLAGELSPNYLFTKKISIGLYYLYSRGLDEGAPKNTHFLTLNSNFSNIRLPNNFFMKFTPQIYYLKQDNRDGYYYTAAITVARKNFPLSVSSIINKAIRTGIVSKDFVWNLNLIYSFNKTYARQK
jgi:hypothetical protein